MNEPSASTAASASTATPAPARPAGAVVTVLVILAITAAVFAAVKFAGSIDYTDLSRSQSNGATGTIAALVARLLAMIGLLVLGLRRNQHPTVRADALIGDAYLLTSLAGR